jgi:Protein of unknown function, DUF255
MKYIFVAIILFISPVFTKAQVNFEDISFNQALAKAKGTGKLIFLQYEAKNCTQCNEVADKAFTDKKLGDILNSSFICLKISLENKDREKVSGIYHKGKGQFGSLFLYSDGTLIHSYPGSTTFIKKYEEEINKALTKASEGTNLLELEKQYKTGNRTPGLMEFLIQTKKSLDFSIDSLLDEYVLLLPADSLSSMRTLSFLTSMAPILESNASIILRRNADLFNRVWYSFPSTERAKINSSIGYKSIQKAISLKDEAYANRIAKFIKNTYTSNQIAGQKVFDYKLLEYYKGVNDTTLFFTHAVLYYDKYFMTITPDSIKKADSLRLRSMIPKLSEMEEVQEKRKGDTITYSKSIAFSQSTQTYANILKDAAEDFFLLTDNPVLLHKAILWVKKANEFYESYTAFNILGNLYLKTGQKTEAYEAKQKALLLKKKAGFDTKDLEIELIKLKD